MNVVTAVYHKYSKKTEEKKRSRNAIWARLRLRLIPLQERHNTIVSTVGEYI